MSSHGPDRVCTQQPWTERSRVCPGRVGRGRYCADSGTPRPRARRCPGRDTGRKARVTGPRPGWCHEGKPAPRTHGGAVWRCVTRLPAHGALSGPGPGPSVDAQESRSGASPQHPEACEGPWPGRAWRVAGRVTRGVRRCQPGPRGGAGAPAPALPRRPLRRPPSPRPGTAAPARPWAPAPPALSPPAGSDASAIDVLMACGVRGDELESVPRAQGDL